ncbi:MAG: NAD(P)-dependent alcohol dehydrogenase [Steroidobacteraceae bacterium]
MKAWQIVSGTQIDGLTQAHLPGAPLGPRDVRVELKAATLNFRDLMVVRGHYGLAPKEPLVPGSDGAGVVTEIGSDVTRFRPGDRVASSFFPAWSEGKPSRAKFAGALGGGGTKGTLAEELVLSEDAWIASPKGLSFVQAAALTCAGTTAWNALFVSGNVKAGDTVVLLGTGGVSIWALQLAKAAGARVILTSSSDEKLERARKLGADETINYRATPAWGARVLELTDGEGADQVVEVGGEKTLEQSIACVRVGGTITIIGAVSGPGGAIPPRSLIVSSARVIGVFVGSRQMHADLARAVAINGIQPVVDRSFGFDETPAAYRHFESGQHFGKVGISFEK